MIIIITEWLTWVTDAPGTCALLMHKKNTSKDFDRRDKNNNNDNNNKYYFIQL